MLTSRYFLGPIYFFTNTYTWDNLHNAAGDNYLDADAWDATKAITPTCLRQELLPGTGWLIIQVTHGCVMRPTLEA